MSDFTTVTNGLYDKSAELGTTMSMIYLIGAIVIGVIFIISAIMNFMSKPQTTITKINNETKTTTSNPTSLGTISLIVAFIIVGLAYFNYYLTKHNKAFASYEGVQAFSKAI